MNKIAVWSSHGVHPRDFTIVEKSAECKSFLVITNMNSDYLFFVERNKKTGMLAANVYVHFGVRIGI